MIFDHNQIFTRNKEVEEGKFYAYKETPLFCLVLCLKNLSDKEYIRFELKVFDVLDDNFKFFIGNKFSCSAATGKYGYWAMWKFYDMEYFSYVKLRYKK
ncbi:hypothetical protein BH23BAC1_BH23BAC1_30310 [soil metagenome]